MTFNDNDKQNDNKPQMETEDDTKHSIIKHIWLWILFRKQIEKSSIEIDESATRSSQQQQAADNFKLLLKYLQLHLVLFILEELMTTT